MNITRSILFSLPATSKVLSYINIAVNTVILLLAVDLVLYPLLDDARNVVFTRVGAVYPDAVKLVVRYPAPNATENEVHIMWRQIVSSTETSWHAGPHVNLKAEDDWVGIVKLEGLWPSTSYEC